MKFRSYTSRIFRMLQEDRSTPLKVSPEGKLVSKKIVTVARDAKESQGEIKS